MVKNVQDDVLKCLVLSTTQRYSVYCHRGGKKPEKTENSRSLRSKWFVLLIVTSVIRPVERRYEIVEKHDGVTGNYGTCYWYRKVHNFWK